MMSRALFCLFHLGILITVSVSSASACASNEKFDSCGTACPVTCSNRNTNFGCPDVCVDGCFCAEGLVRAVLGGPCIPEDDCDIALACTANEEYNDCGSDCPKTCQNLDDTDSECNDMCVQGCFCKSGYVRSITDGPCVPVADCSK